MMEIFIIIVIVSAIWVYFDAKTIGVKKGQLIGLADLSPIGWLLTSLGLWIIAFPLYLAKRPEYKKINSK